MLHKTEASRQANVLALIDDVTTGIKIALDQAHIDIPYPQIVVHGEGQQQQLNENDKLNGPVSLQIAWYVRHHKPR